MTGWTGYHFPAASIYLKNEENRSRLKRKDVSYRNILCIRIICGEGVSCVDFNTISACRLVFGSLRCESALHISCDMIKERRSQTKPKRKNPKEKFPKRNPLIGGFVSRSRAPFSSSIQVRLDRYLNTKYSRQLNFMILIERHFATQNDRAFLSNTYSVHGDIKFSQL